MGSTLMDDVECGNFFEQIDDLIDFPPDNECGSGLIGSGDSKTIPSIWDGALQDANNRFPGCNGNSAADLSAELAIPYEDILQLEWLSTFVEDSFSGGGMTLAKDIVKKEPSQKPFSTSSPVSVLESSSNSSSCSSEVKANPVTPSHHGAQRARSKRPRPATLCPCTSVQLISPNSSSENHLTVVPGISSESESVGESEHAKECHKTQAMEGKKKKIKLKIPLGPIEINQKTGTQAVRKCQHCGISKTPQWRGGPMGPKTLCNACGVRYKSGRLFPEYRPAASPTYVPSLHSNSHRKVVEMRNKVGEENSVQGTEGPVSIGHWSNIIPDINNHQ